jgi:hypothetical protein
VAGPEEKDYEMKITKVLVREFEKDQKLFGIAISLNNLLWMVASDMFKDLGVKRVQTTYKNPRIGHVSAEQQ